MSKYSAVRFGAVGSLSTLVDLLAYSICLVILPGAFLVSKAFGFISGTLVGFVLNKQWTFGHMGTSAKTLPKYLLLYAATLILNLLSNQLILSFFGTTIEVKAGAFLFATAVSAITNFLVMKRFIFRGQE